MTTPPLFAFRTHAPLALLCAATLAVTACGSSDDIVAAPAQAAPAPAAPASAASSAGARTIIMVWDGLRPDSVTATDTPTLYAMAQAGVRFADNHSTYPTFTMMNGQSFATGSFPGTSGFYGNTFWTPPRSGASAASGAIPVGKGAGGAAQDYTDPVFTEDYAVLTTLDAYYSGQLLLVKTLFQAAQEKNLVTATVGKSGAAFIQDLKKKGYILEENTVFPASLVQEMQAAGSPLPANIVNDATYSPAVTLSAANGNPTAQIATVTAPLGTTGLVVNNADNKAGGRATDANRYMMDAYVKFVLPKKPDLSLIWFREPDSTEHAYGPGSANHKLALAAQDDRLKELMAGLKAQGLDTTTNIVVVSDHAHSNVSGPLALFPLRAIPTTTAIGAVDAAKGYSSSGDVRSADLLARNGFTHVYDGSGCLSTGMSGIKADGTLVYPTTTYVDTDGTKCGGAAGRTYQTGNFKVPATLPTGSTGDQPIVIAVNGGSDYFYVPSHDAATIAKLVSVLQKRLEYGAVFVDSRYGSIAGALPLSTIKLENATRKDDGQPDVVASFNFDDTATINGVPGIEFEGFSQNRGMHGSFSPIDVHNTLIAAGPSFKSATVVSTPSGNVDLAPTIAYVLGGTMPQADGRVLYEALASSLNPANIALTASSVVPSVVKPTAPATGIVFESPLDPTGATKDTSFTAGAYSIDLAVKDLTQDGKIYRYFDSARPVRK